MTLGLYNRIKSRKFDFKSSTHKDQLLNWLIQIQNLREKIYIQHELRTPPPKTQNQICFIQKLEFLTSTPVNLSLYFPSLSYQIEILCCTLMINCKVILSNNKLKVILKFTID